MTVIQSISDNENCVCEESASLAQFLYKHDTLSNLYASKKRMQKMPVKINDKDFTFSPGKHNQLQKAIIEEFAPRFAPHSECLYVGDTIQKDMVKNIDKLSALGFEITLHDKMPDVVLYREDKNWIYFIESVTSVGPMDPKRILEIESMTENVTAGKIYVTAFLDFVTFKKFSEQLAWETEVWIADMPDHMIHDRIAFMRICSGKYEKAMEVYHVQGNKKMRLSQPQQLMAQDREVIDEAYAGDIIGVFDPGIFSIGDTVCSPNAKFKFEGIPTFAPEHFNKVRLKDTMKRKQFVKGITQIAQEGAIQIFRELDSGMEEVIVGVVGVLQFDVLEYRLKNEYGVDIIMEGLPYDRIRWIENEDLDPKTLDLASDTKRIEDLKGNHLLLFTSDWSISWATEHNKELILAEFGR